MHSASSRAGPMDYLFCVQKTSLSIEGRTIRWRDNLDLLVRSFELGSPPLDATFCSFHNELILSVLLSPQLLRMHYIDGGGAQDIHLNFEIQRIHYCHFHQAIICVSHSAGLYSITWPSLQPYPITIHSNDTPFAFNISASTLDLICTVHDSLLRIWRLAPHQGGFDEERRLSISVSNRSSMSPRTESRLIVMVFNVIECNG